MAAVAVPVHCTLDGARFFLRPQNRQWIVLQPIEWVFCSSFQTPLEALGRHALQLRPSQTSQMPPIAAQALQLADYSRNQDDQCHEVGCFDTDKYSPQHMER